MTQPRLPLPYIGPEIYATLVAERDFDPAALVVAAPAAAPVVAAPSVGEAAAGPVMSDPAPNGDPGIGALDALDALDALVSDPAPEVTPDTTAPDAPALPAAFIGLGSHFAALPSIPPMVGSASTGAITGEPPAAAAC